LDLEESGCYQQQQTRAQEDKPPDPSGSKSDQSSRLRKEGSLFR
jgi:hypothetical protein